MILGAGVGLVFFDCVLPRFCSTFWRFVPETVRKKSLYVRSSVFGLVLSLGFPSTSFCCFSRGKDQVVTGHPHTRLFWFFLLLDSVNI